ncbi:MAG: hypothetical protein Q3983_06065 [Capnocytophaga sp.]|nr:hypothetical protein [Capnocytophaga sp.]
MATQNQVVTPQSGEPKKRGGGFIIALLGLAVAGLGGYSFYLNNEKAKNEKVLNEQKTQMLKELQELQKEYEDAVSVSKQNADELSAAKVRISQYIDSLKTMKVDIQTLWKYHDQVQVLKKERTRLLAINDSLRKYNKRILQERDSTYSALSEKSQLLDSVAQKNTELNDVLKQGAILTLKNLSAVGVKERSGGRYVEKERAGAIDKIKICYTVSQNRIAERGNRLFYVQVLDPQNVTLGENELISVGDKTVNYSAATKFLYERQNVDVCEYIISDTKKYESGVYKIVVFDEELNELGQIDLRLR